MLDHWGMQGTPSLPSLSDPFWPSEVAPERVLSMGQIELNCIPMDHPIGPVGRVFTSDQGDLGSIPHKVIPKTQKMVLDAFLLNT